MTAPLVFERDSGSVTVTTAALARLVTHAAEDGDGARIRRPRRRSLDVAHRDGNASVKLDLVVPYGAVLPELARGVQERVADALTEMCGLEVERVDVAIEELD